jgi:hypothetical protein
MRKILFFVLSAVLFTACVKPFNPPVISSGNLNYLVVDGFIVPGSATTIKLSRTLNISDSFQFIPERNAQLFIEGLSGSSFSFQTGNEGVYTSPAVFLSPDDKYRLHIILQDGKEYASDYEEVKQSPPVDSLEFQEDDDISIYVNTHDSTGKARYYKWEYDETMEYHAIYESFLEFKDGQIIFLEPDEYRYKCYKIFQPKNNIAIGTSAALSEDVIRHARITSFPKSSNKIVFRYSLHVKQYALTADAYKYWQTLQANTEQNGNIFDPQPAQLRSNIHSLSNPDEPVIGYVSISNFTENRIFIRYAQLKVRPPLPYQDVCPPQLINPGSAADYLSDGEFKPAYYTRTGGLVIAPKICVDCRLQGGTTEKPSYW